MADTEEKKDDKELLSLKCNLEKYRELLLPLKKVIEWDKQYYPAVLVAFTTVVFALVWYCELSVLSTFCILGIVVTVADFATPFVVSSLFKSDWTVFQEREFDAICLRLLNAKRHITNARSKLTKLKAESPKSYLVVMTIVFALLAWFGSLIDNLLLTYLFVMGLSLVPGLRKRGILQKLTQKVGDTVANLRSGKAKTN